jgi:biotin synthase
MQEIRYDWGFSEIAAIYDRPLLELVVEASQVHRKHFDGQEVQVSSLVSVKTGGCSEDCHYCPQSARYATGLKRKNLMELAEVVDSAKKAKAKGASRVCLGAAWRQVKDGKQFDRILEMVKEVNARGLEVCCTLGMINQEQANKLKEAGLYAYNHNVDTSKDYYKSIITTRSYQNRLDTLEHVRKAKLTVCSGGIIGLGENKKDRIGMLLTLSSLNPHPESVPINTLVAVKGTPLEKQEEVSTWDLLRMIATTRIVLPRSFVRLSAGRLGRSIETQALCFLAGANSIFSGDKLLTTPNPDFVEDEKMFEILGLKSFEPVTEEAHENPSSQHAAAATI